MLGFTAVFGRDASFIPNKKSQKQLNGDGYFFDFFSNDKFNSDKIFEERNRHILVLDGVVLNKKTTADPIRH